MEKTSDHTEGNWDCGRRDAPQDTHATRRDFLKAAALLAAQFALGPGAVGALAQGLEKIASGQQRVLWLQGLSCTGCSISLLDSDGPIPLEVLTEIISLVYHPNLSSLQ